MARSHIASRVGLLTLLLAQRARAANQPAEPTTTAIAATNATPIDAVGNNAPATTVHAASGAGLGSVNDKPRNTAHFGGGAASLTTPRAGVRHNTTANAAIDMAHTIAAMARAVGCAASNAP